MESIKEMDIEAVLNVPESVTEDIVWDKFIEWVENNKWLCTIKVKDVTNVIPETEVLGEPVQEEKSIDQYIQDLLKNEKVRQDCLANANDFDKRMKGEWFTVSHLYKKVNLNNKPALKGVLDMLCLFGMCYRKVIKGDYIKYKITINDTDRLKILNSEVSELEGKIFFIKEEIKKISNNTNV